MAPYLWKGLACAIGAMKSWCPLDIANTCFLLLSALPSGLASLRCLSGYPPPSSVSVQVEEHYKPLLTASPVTWFSFVSVKATKSSVPPVGFSDLPASVGFHVVPLCSQGAQSYGNRYHATVNYPSSGLPMVDGELVAWVGLLPGHGVRCSNKLDTLYHP